MNVESDRICANEPDIASKIIDGEAILINLQTGAYYSLRDAGALIWQAVCGHRTRSEVLETLAAQYSEKPSDLETDLSELFIRLEEENLVRLSERDRAGDAAGPALLVPPATYQKPNLEKFTDMEELLALDPPTPGALDGLMRQSLGGRDR